MYINKTLDVYVYTRTNVHTVKYYRGIYLVLLKLVVFINNSFDALTAIRVA